SFGESASEDWTGEIAIDSLATAEFSAARATFDLGGLARDLDNPAARSITFAVDGLLSGIVATRADIGEALGTENTLDIDGAWSAGEAVQLANAILSGNDLSVSLQGDIAQFAFNGNIGVEARSIAPFSGLAGRDLKGALDLRATGEIRPISGAFDL